METTNNSKLTPAEIEAQKKGDVIQPEVRERKLGNPSGKSQKIKELTAKQTEWMKNDFWPTPSWYSKQPNLSSQKDYDSLYKYELRSRYYELESDFRTAYNNFAPKFEMDFTTAGRVVNFLQTARVALEKEQVNVLSVANLLDLIDRYMIWLLPDYIVVQRALTKAGHLKSNYPHLAERLAGLCNDEELRGSAKITAIKSAYDEIVGDVNDHSIQSFISAGLQLERLSILKRWGIISLIIIIFSFPFLLNFEGTKLETFITEGAVLGFINSISPLFLNLLIILCLTLIGGIGGFISGLLQVRNTRVNLVMFKESLLKFQLKPIVGGITSALVVLFLSWQILPGITIQSFGSFILLAFLTGFSERYFLGLLKIDPKGEDNIEMPNLKEKP